MCPGPHKNQGWGWRCETGLSPPVKYFTDRSKAVLLLWIFYVFVLSCVCYVCARLFICALWSPAGKGLTSWLSFVVSSVSLSLSHWYPGSGVVLDCIDSWSLHLYLLWGELLWLAFVHCPLSNVHCVSSISLSHSIYHMVLSCLWNCIFEVKMLRFCHYEHNVVMDIIT